MKIACISDMHGHLPETIPECDVLVIAGDICPAVAGHEYEFQKDWLHGVFNPWVSHFEATGAIALFVAGNHDWAFEVDSSLRIGLEGSYLQDEVEDYAGIRFYGHPWTPSFCGWAFNSGTEALKRHSAQIPMDTDVLITHGPPLRILDVPGGSGRHGYPRRGTHSDVSEADAAPLLLGRSLVLVGFGGRDRFLRLLGALAVVAPHLEELPAEVHASDHHCDAKENV